MEKGLGFGRDRSPHGGESFELSFLNLSPRREVVKPQHLTGEGFTGSVYQLNQIVLNQSVSD